MSGIAPHHAPRSSIIRLSCRVADVRVIERVRLRLAIRCRRPHAAARACGAGDGWRVCRGRCSQGARRLGPMLVRKGRPE